MTRQQIWKVVILAAMILGLAAAAPAKSKSMDQAMHEMAADIKAKHHEAGRDVTSPPSQPLGGTKTVRFTLPMKAGKGRDSVNQYCMGYTLKCVARVTDPGNTYSGQVSTSEGSLVSFKGKKNGQPLELVLDTSFWGETTFSLDMWAQDEPWPEMAQVEMTCSY